MAFDVSTFIAGQANALGDVTSQIGRQGESFQTLPALFKDRITTHNCRVKVRKDIIQGGSYFIIGHPTYGKLSSPIYYDVVGVGSNYIEYIYNDNNLFPEQFLNDRFIDHDLSTGSFYTGSYYEVPDDKDLITTYIAKEDKVYKSINIYNLEAEYPDGTDASNNLAISAIIDNIEYPLNIGITPITNISNDGIRLKFHNINTTVQFGEEGLSFPISFASIDPIRIKYFDCKYSE